MISYGIILKSKIIYLFTYKQFLYNFVTFYIKIFKQISKNCTTNLQANINALLYKQIVT